MSAWAKFSSTSNSLVLGDETYVLQRTDRSASSLFRFDDPRFEPLKQYVYNPLPPKMIRLMRLNSGDREDSIQCELFEAAYDNSFHIPTRVSREWDDSESREPEQRNETDAERELEEVKQRLSPLVKEMKEMKEIEMKALDVTWWNTARVWQLANPVWQTVGGTWNTRVIDRPRAMEETRAKMRLRVIEEEVGSLKITFEGLKGRILREELESVERIEIEYEALSWCWGRAISDYVVLVTKGDESYKMPVRRDLALALKYLRHQGRPRILWIDAICIDQENDVERNQQVQMMSRIYTRAANVCIWLGQQDNESEVAFKFIKEEITHLKDFDSISSDKDYGIKWQALMVLMQREWFSRRWVVQELSLANKAEIWCGPDSMPWKEFAVAVELFVEVESATHRLSEVIQKDVQFRHVPGWFEYVSQLGASLLVQATGKVFRSYGTPMDRNEVDDKDPDTKMTDEEKATEEAKAKEKAAKQKHDERAESLDSIQTIDPLDRRSLLSLEYLVTTMFIFKASECRDSVYSMLAIARDAAPFASDTITYAIDEVPGATNAASVIKPVRSTNDADLPFLLSLFQGFLAEKPFLVDYTRPYSDVCRDFMEFCIWRKNAHDPVQALDILCRPWALEPQLGSSARVKKKKRKAPADRAEKPTRLTCERSPQWKQKYSDYEEYRKWLIEKSIKWSSGRARKLCEDSRKRKAQEKKQNQDDKNQMEPIKDIALPSWVPRAKNAPFEIYRHPGMQIKKTGRANVDPVTGWAQDAHRDFKKTGRANADPLVGWPQDGHRNYSAAQTETVKLDYLRFKKRPRMGHYSLYVTGFKVDEIDEVRDASQGGSIPNSWLELSGWEPPYTQDPPPEFWRTIVADRGIDNRNPPYYYARACRESVDKGGRESGRVNTTALINNERNSIIAEFCRRVHAVIWGRSLFKTKEEKKDGDRDKERFEDQYQAFKSCVQRLEKTLVCRKRYQKQKEKYMKQGEDTTAVSSWEQDVKDAREIVNKELAKDKERRDKEREEVKEQRGRKETPKQRFKQDEETFYVFKGESYVHGCMDGEAVRRRFYGTEEEWIYELR
ncbi:uncharacterized protein J4E79_002726 [Alternaria viburni]|uniref:uncharacterized protein n=1 Tax=Alternaria viburni TaxID=566460 RepID=UPI0020C41217|nr:uncharacterized protein J4E79_002726 [Alternaria viburni]KAI4666686.1 hypothetical protein J4E79_002726 [Alternaria viburni]